MLLFMHEVQIILFVCSVFSLYQDWGSLSNPFMLSLILYFFIWIIVLQRWWRFLLYFLLECAGNKAMKELPNRHKSQHYRLRCWNKYLGLFIKSNCLPLQRPKETCRLAYNWFFKKILLCLHSETKNRTEILKRGAVVSYLFFQLLLWHD